MAEATVLAMAMPAAVIVVVSSVTSIPFCTGVAVIVIAIIG
jgi:hypothetical protein